MIFLLYCSHLYTTTFSFYHFIYCSKPNLTCDWSVPCQPQRFSANMDCWTSTGLMSWEEGQGALSYLVQAVGADGYQTQCLSTNTSCSLPSLQCGQLYNLTSFGQDGYCNSSAAQANLQSGTQLQNFSKSLYSSTVFEI